MSFMTPPPESEEFTGPKAVFNNTSYIVEDGFYTSPSSLRSKSRSESYPPHTPPSCHQDQSFLKHINGPQQRIFVDNSAPLTFVDSNMPHDFGMDTPFDMYEHGSYTTFPGMSEHYSMSSGHSGSNFFATYHAPQSTIPVNTSTDSATTMSPPSYCFIGAPLPASYSSPPLRQTFSPESSSSMSTYSRSCSPDTSYTGVANHGIRRKQSSRSSSITSASSPLSNYGIPVRALGSSTGSNPQLWRCAYPNCTSRATFIRGCDLRKHYNRHSKHLFCRVDGCPQSEAAAVMAAHEAEPHRKNSLELVLSGGFSSKKDRARHEAKHNPGIKCEWQGSDGDGCSRVFSRMDNMKDHVRRIHQKGHHTGTGGDKSKRLKRSR